MADVHVCDECGKRLATIGGLEIHMALAHGADVPPPPSADSLDVEPTMSVASAPEQASPPMHVAAEPPRPPRKPFLGGIDPAEPLAWVLTVLLFVGAVAAAIHHPHPPSDVTGVVAASSSKAAPETPARAADEELLKGAVVQPGDLSGEWTQIGAEADPDPAAPDACVKDPVWSSVVAGRSSEYSFRLQSNGLEAGHLVSVVSSSKSADITAKRLAVISSAEYRGCAVKSLEQSLRDANGPTTVIGSTTVNPLTAPIPDSGIGWQLVSHFHSQGHDIVVTVDNYHLAVGRFLAHVDIQHCACDGVSPATWADTDATVLQVIARRLAQVAAV